MKSGPKIHTVAKVTSCWMQMKMCLFRPVKNTLALANVLVGIKGIAAATKRRAGAYLTRHEGSGWLLFWAIFLELAETTLLLLLIQVVSLVSVGCCLSNIQKQDLYYWKYRATLPPVSNMCGIWGGVGVGGWGSENRQGWGCSPVGQVKKESMMFTLLSLWCPWFYLVTLQNKYYHFLLNWGNWGSETSSHSLVSNTGLIMNSSQGSHGERGAI